MLFSGGFVLLSRELGGGAHCPLFLCLFLVGNMPSVVWRGPLRFLLLVSCGPSGTALSGLEPSAECDRAALAVWLRKLDLSPSRSEDDLSLPSADEAMLVWLVTSVRLGWTPREVLIWLFPVFGDLLFPMISDLSEGA